MQIEQDRLYTIKDLAQLFGLSPRTVQRLWQRRRLPGRKVGRRVVFVGRDLLEQLPKPQ